MGEILVLKTQSENREIPIYDTAPSKPYLGIKGKGYIPLLEGMSGNGIYIKNGSAKYALQELVLEPVVFSSDSNFTLSVATPMWDGTMQYSTNNGNTWSDWDGSQLSGTANQPILLRGHNNSIISSTYCWNFTGKYIRGNIENLLDCKTVARGEHPTMGSYCYAYMFQNCGALTTAPTLPATTLAEGCYNSMFLGCTSLTTAPTLPATTLADNCYYQMFRECASLTTPPALPATTLANQCYGYMFYNCESLTTAPTLSATTLADKCYSHMFSYCISLTTPPRLPATTLTTYCYYGMFLGCTSLTTVTKLSATTLANYCYREMFENCTSLTTAHTLPATTLAYYCYGEMFGGCTSLINPPELPATTLASDCYYGMFRRCTSLTTIPELPATTLASYCYQSMFDDCTSIKLSTTWDSNTYKYLYIIPASGTGTTATGALENMFADTGGTFTGTPTINTTYYTDHGVDAYLTFSSDSNFQLYSYTGSKTWDGTLEYSTGGAWTTWNGAPLNGTASQPIYLRGTGNTVISGNSTSYRWMFTGKYITGNIETLLDYKKVAKGQHPTMGNYCFAYMFYSTSLITPPDLLATTLSPYCYYQMFYGCSRLTTAPILSATTLSDYCYYYMFGDCTSLTTTPELPATTLANCCYYGMFYNCTSLTTLPELPATTLTNSCYRSMFSYCTSIKLSSSMDFANGYIYPYRIPSSGTGTTVSNALSSMFANTGGTYTGTPAINTTYYTDHGDTLPYLIFTSDSSSSFQLYPYNSIKTWNGTLEYSGNGSTWYTWSGQTLSGNASNPIFIRGTGNTRITGSGVNGIQWTFTGKQILGNIETLLDYQTVQNGSHPTMDPYCFVNMFNGCTSLTTPPALPATTLSQYCYYRMFEGCTSLTTAPELPATTLTNYCYYNMFKGCTSLTTPPALPATTLSQYCYYGMFERCTSLSTAPQLSATTLANSCYCGMFYNCTSLTTAPILSATTLAGYCYSSMFQGCTALIIPPELPATVLAEACYQQMFYNCSSLRLSTSQTGNYNNPYRIPTSGTGTTASNALTNMFAGTSGSFTGTPSINTTYYYSTIAPQAYLEFSSNSSFTLQVPSKSRNWDGTIQYSTNNGSSWTTWSGSQLSGTAQQSIWLRGINNTVITGGNYPWTFTGKYITGNIEALLDYHTVQIGGHPTMAASCFRQMFSNCTTLITPPELPATTLSQYCYYQMFYQCTALTTLPNLPATTLANYCYQGMFRYCSSLRLSASKTGNYQYAYRIPTSGTGKTATNALNNMFSNTGGSFTSTPSINTVYYTYNEPVG